MGGRSQLRRFVLLLASVVGLSSACRDRYCEIDGQRCVLDTWSREAVENTPSISVVTFEVRGKLGAGDLCLWLEGTEPNDGATTWLVRPLREESGYDDGGDLYGFGGSRCGERRWLLLDGGLSLEDDLLSVKVELRDLHDDALRGFIDAPVSQP
jgi:hypothetical protein